MAIGLGGIGGAAGVFVLIVIVFWIVRQRSEGRAKYGTSAERRLERKEGFGRIANTFRGLIQRKKREEREIEKKEKGKEKGASREEKDEDKTVEATAETVKKEKETEEATEALEGRGVGLLASVKSVLSSVENYLVRAKASMQREEQDIASLKELMKKLKNTSNFAAIDERVATYLRQLFNSIKQVISRAVEDEHEKETHHGELVKRLREAAKEAKGVIGAARTALNDLKGAEKKERKNFKKELKNISNIIRDKKRELNKIRKSKEADRTAIIQLQREIVLLEQQRRTVEQLNKQLQSTYNTMDREAREIKNILSRISKREKQIGKHEKTADKREKDVEKRYSSLNKLKEELAKSTENLTNLHELAIQFSGKLNEFYERYKEIITGDLEFDEEIRNVLLLNISVAIQMEAYERMSISLEEAEAAVEQGMGASVSMVASIVGGEDQHAALGELIKNIKSAGGEINYEVRVEQFLQQLTRRMEQESGSVNAQITGLVNEDKKLADEIERAKQENSGAIGTVMGAMVNRKVQIDSNYMAQARQFEQQLQQRNSIAAQAYRQARGLEAKRAA